MRRQYPFHLIEPKWQQHWETEQTFKAFNPGDTIPAGHPFAKRHGLGDRNVAAPELPPKFYILDMFPYPSGAGLHVGHPEGYTATDILARYRRAKGNNVLHPMGWDSFGLPAEQYAVKTGQHPRVTTETNIANFTRQIKSLGFSYDWTRELATTDPEYFRWTQWIFLQLYNAWFNPETNKAEPISTLKYPEELNGARLSEPQQATPGVAASQLGSSSAQAAGCGLESRAPGDLEARRRDFRDSKRLAYVSEAPVNWCPELGTVLANEEVIDGKSEVGGFPVVRKPMRQWMLRITAYAEKLLADLDTIDWSDSLKEMQRNWIGRSEGAEVTFEVLGGGPQYRIKVFTTRPDTLFGATYLVLAPEHRFVYPITTPFERDKVQSYQAEVAKKSDLERTELAKEKTGVFTGGIAINPVNGEKIPIWIADYVLASYGTGAIMAVPAHDERDFEFAVKFRLPIKPVVKPPLNWLSDKGGHLESQVKADRETLIWTYPELVNAASTQGNAFESQAYEVYARQAAEFRAAFTELGDAMNSAHAELSLNGLPTAEAKAKITAWLEEKGLGKRTINYKLRDWLFSRQRYWGEPFPIVWKRDASGNLYHEALPESALPLLPPTLEDYKPTTDGQPPLARAKDWVTLPDGSTRETNTMPQWAGSCWYYLRYLDAKNGATFVGKEVESYWMGSVAAVCDRRINQESTGGHRLPLQTPGVDLYVGGTEHAVLHLLYARFWHKVLFDLGHVSTAEPFFKLVNQGLILGEDGQKMSKSRGNTVNPDDILNEFGADAFRLYEMFMGPLQDTKPWNTRGVEGVYRFLGRVWRLFIDEQSEKDYELAETTGGSPAALLGLIKLNPAIQEISATPAPLKALHACIKKVTEDLDGMRFNTAISAMMVFINEAMTWETKPAAVLKTFLQLLAPFAPHVAEELWDRLHSKLGIQSSSLTYSPWPAFDAALLVEDTIEIPVQVDGKLRNKVMVPTGAPVSIYIETAKLDEKVKQFLVGREIKKEIVVQNKMISFVTGKAPGV